MKILFLSWESFGKKYILDALKKMGHDILCFSHNDFKERTSFSFDQYFDDLMKEDSYDCCFSSNYFPVLSNACNRYHLPYISWVYDSPQVALYSYTVINPCNYIFIFDKSEVIKFQKAGITTIHYMPLASDTHTFTSHSSNRDDIERFSSDISFVGSLYNEDHNFLDRMKDLDEYTKGYLNGIMQAQMKIYGYFFLEEVLSDSIIASMKKSLDYTPHRDGVETEQYVYANYFLGRKITEMERIHYLQQLSEKFNVKIFTLQPTPMLPKVQNMGTVDYYSQMPLVFYYSKINLNITLRSIHSGIPLRAMDIMGSGGFLLTNFQEDFLDFFEPDQDFVYFTDEQELLEKTEFYLSNDIIRKKISENGFKKINDSHTYLYRLKEIFTFVFPEN